MGSSSFSLFDGMGVNNYQAVKHKISWIKLGTEGPRNQGEYIPKEMPKVKNIRAKYLDFREDGGKWIAS